MFSCRVCAEKDKRVQVLESEITFLRNLVHKPVDNSTITENEMEADGIMSGQDRVIEIEPRAQYEAAEDEFVTAERQALLDGTY
jgi:hypothetical protein